MAEKKAPGKSATAKPKSTAKSKTAAGTASDSASADPSGQAVSAGAADTPVRGTCTAEKCGRPLRAKGYCRKHFMAWRRGKLGGHHQYKICTKEACRKPRQFGSLCAEHAGKGVPATPADAGAPAAP